MPIKDELLESLQIYKIEPGTGSVIYRSTVHKYGHSNEELVVQEVKPSLHGTALQYHAACFNHVMTFISENRKLKPLDLDRAAKLLFAALLLQETRTQNLLSKSSLSQDLVEWIHTSTAKDGNYYSPEWLNLSPHIKLNDFSKPASISADPDFIINLSNIDNSDDEDPKVFPEIPKDHQLLALQSLMLFNSKFKKEEATSNLSQKGMFGQDIKETEKVEKKADGQDQAPTGPTKSSS